MCSSSSTSTETKLSQQFSLEEKRIAWSIISCLLFKSCDLDMCVPNSSSFFELDSRTLRCISTDAWEMQSTTSWPKTSCLYIYISKFEITKSEWCKTFTHKNPHYSIVESVPRLSLSFLNVVKFVTKISILPFFFLFSFLFIMHNSNTIGCIWTLDIRNKYNTIKDLPFLV